MWAQTINQSQIILQESNGKEWNNNNEIIKAKKPLHYKTQLWIIWSIINNIPFVNYMTLHEERSLSYIHECHNDRSTILSTTLNYFPIITRYDPFKSSTHLSHILDKICHPNIPWYSPLNMFEWLSQIFFKSSKLEDKIRFWG